MKKFLLDTGSFESSLVSSLSFQSTFKLLLFFFFHEYLLSSSFSHKKSTFAIFFNFKKRNSSTSIFVSICSGFHLSKRFMSANLSSINILPSPFSPVKREKTRYWWRFKCKKSFSSVEFLSEPRRMLRSLPQSKWIMVRIEERKWKWKLCFIFVFHKSTNRGKLIFFFRISFFIFSRRFDNR